MTNHILILVYFGTLTAALPAHAPQASDRSVASGHARKELKSLRMMLDKDSFVRAASDGNITAVQLFIAAGMNPEVRSADGNTALVAATPEQSTINNLGGDNCD